MGKFSEIGCLVMDDILRNPLVAGAGKLLHKLGLGKKMQLLAGPGGAGAGKLQHAIKGGGAALGVTDHENIGTRRHEVRAM